MPYTIITIAIFLFAIIIDAIATLAVYGAHMQDTPRNREIIKKIFENPDNEYRYGIFHVHNATQRSIVWYISRIRTIISYYNVRGLGWVSRFSPLKKYIDDFYKQAKMTAELKSLSGRHR